MVYKMINITWNPDADITRVKYLKDYNESDWITRLDVLKDAMGELRETYNDLLTDDSKDQYEDELKSTARLGNKDLDVLYEYLIKNASFHQVELDGLLDLLNDYVKLRNEAHPIFTEKGEDEFLRDASKLNLTKE